MSDIQNIETNDEQEHENKHKISSPPNEFIMNSKYENSLETSFKKLNSDSTSVISSSSDNDSASEIDSFRSNITLKLSKSIRRDNRKNQRSRSLFNKKKNYLFDVVNEDASENDTEKENISFQRKHYSNFKIFNKIMRSEMNTFDSLKLNNRMNSEKIFKPTEMEPVFEVKEEVEKPENPKKTISSSRLKIIKDSKEDTISHTHLQQFYSTANLYDHFVDTIAEDNNENLVENEISAGKTHKKIENFVDKLEDIEEINNDLCIDTLNIDPIKEENNEDEEYNLDKKHNNQGYSQFEDESERWNYNSKGFVRGNYSVMSEEDRIIEDACDDERNNEENELNDF